MSNDGLWYKDAVIYEAHVRSFFDSTNDGIGDFAGLTQKLPYLHDLGITCIWLLPFYPSPLKDDGYDIADYTSINQMYGGLEDFTRFVAAAHALNIRVLTELVVNHTSDQHPWFRRARQAPAGSPERDFYVWSDSDQKYAGTRIIFTDTEQSNWTFDAVAGQYYWHRFFSHQPDLNLDNLAVQDAVLDVMRFWLRHGVDALRLDAIPYLIEREGTINENLPETHQVLKRLRAAVDAEFPGRVLLAEANQWPADVRAYFGDGDECHMSFHFPLMPRMFMALRQEDRHPIVEIVNQTPEIPPSCQWAIFLRNHDELTLEMVTDEERDYMYSQYAADPQMRINVGIRRRLAPLMENSRPRIELLNSLLFSMPGTPVLYYGDEIGMGDNVFLGDRNGVRTPMQWSSDRNGGFSRADPARLFAPVIVDPVYGYEAINVEAQERSPFSLLHWMKRMIALRRQHPVFGRGTTEFIETANRKVLVYVRRHERDASADTVLCVANMSRTVQPVEIPLQAFRGLTPVEMLGQAQFPPISEEPYFLTLAPYGFYWFQLQEVVTPITARVAPMTPEPAAVPTLFVGVIWENLLDGSLRQILERQALLPFLQRQRWFGGKARPAGSASIVDWATLRNGAYPSFLAIVEVAYRDGGRERYTLPLTMSGTEYGERIERQHPESVLVRISGARKGLLYDGIFDDGTCEILRAAMQEERTLASRHGHFFARHAGTAAREALADPPPIVPSIAPSIRRLPPDQSNSLVMFGNGPMMKLFRKLGGTSSDIEVSEYLADHPQARIPHLLGVIEYTGGSEPPASIGMLQEYVVNQGNGWQFTVDVLGRYFEQALTREGPPEPGAIGTYLNLARTLGRRTGELHVALSMATREDQRFGRELFTAADVRAMASAMAAHAESTLALLEAALPGLDERARPLGRHLLERRSEVLRRIGELAQARDGGNRIRCHGDYHLGQVLVTEGDVVILDFEGEPGRDADDRRRKCSPLRDVAGMVRSFSYAVLTALHAATAVRPDDLERLQPWATLWEQDVRDIFAGAWLDAVRAAGVLPSTQDGLDLVLRSFILDKAVYELGYELNNRPDWAHVPLHGILALLSYTNVAQNRDGSLLH